MTWTPETLAKVIALQRERPWPELGAIIVRLLNQATLAEKAKMTDEAIKSEEQARANYKFKYKEPP
jgi:hypothetical protein